MQIKSHKSVEQIAKKHRMNVSDIQKQLDMGVPIEHEHTRDKVLATDIALQHLDEIPDYYTRLKKMEASAKKEHKKFKDVTEDAVTDLQRGLTELEDASYDSVDSLMRRIMKKRNVTAKKLHDDFVTKHKKTPDSWIKDKNEMKEEKGLWTNIHARRKKDLSPKKPGQQGYPKTLDIEEGLKQARKNVGASKCWTGKKIGNPSTKIKNGKEVPNCVSVEETLNLRTQSESTDSLDYTWNTPIHERADRYCPKCEKLETRNQCKYGTKYWDMFSLPAEVISPKKDYNTTMPHPGNVTESKNPLKDPGTQIKKSSGAGALSPEAAEQLGPKAVELRKKKVSKVDLPKVNKESVTIEDAKGNTFMEIIDIIRPEKIKRMSEDKEETEKYRKFDQTVNAAMASKNSKTRLKVLKHAASVHPSKNKTFEAFINEAKKSEMKCNSPKSEPVGNSLTGKSHVVKACENGKEELIRFGQRGVKGSPKKKGESKAYASRRHRFQTRHAKNISKGKMSAAYWANKVKW